MRRARVKAIRAQSNQDLPLLPPASRIHIWNSHRYIELSWARNRFHLPFLVGGSARAIYKTHYSKYSLIDKLVTNCIISQSFCDPNFILFNRFSFENYFLLPICLNYWREMKHKKLSISYQNSISIIIPVCEVFNNYISYCNRFELYFPTRFEDVFILIMT